MLNNFNYDSTYSIIKRICIDTIIPNIWKFLSAILLMILISSFIGYRAYLIKPAIDKVFVNKDIMQLNIITIKIIIVGIFLALCTYYQGYIMAYTSGKISISLQERLIRAILKSDMDFFVKNSSGRIMSHMSDVKGITSTMSIVLNSLIKQMITIIVLVGIMFYQNFILSCLALIGFPFIVYPVYKIGKKIRKLSNTRQEQGAELSSNLNDSIYSIKLVKISNTEEYEVKKIYNILFKLFSIVVKRLKRSLMVSPMMEMVGSIGFALVIFYGGKQVVNGTSTAGSFFAFMAALFSAYKPAKSFSGLNIKIQDAIACAKRYYITIDREREVIDSPNAESKNDIKGEIELRNISFSYPYHAPNKPFIELNPKKELNKEKALNKISLTFKKGKANALVGHSGSGKSTIFNLLLRFYDIQKGNIFVDGRNIKDITINSLRESISVVNQDIRLFNTTILENIRYGKFDATKEEVINAAKLANAEEFIDLLPHSYNTTIGQNGSLLSGGQRQRVAIARAILQDKPILLLDEATSALDPISEKLIQRALANLMKNRTTITIAHRLSTIMNSDEIFVLEHGELIEQGSHKALMKKSGLYKKLFNTQFEEI